MEDFKLKYKLSKYIITGLLCGTLLGGCGNTESKGSEPAENIEIEASTSPTTYQADYIVQTDTSNLDESYQISDMLYGIFLEDINFALDGGMYAELIKNRSFEYGNMAGNVNRHGWIVSDTESQGFTFTVTNGEEDGTGLNVNNPNYAILTNLETGYRGIYNRGFLEGLTLHAEADYMFTGYFRAPDGYHGDIKVSLRDSNDKVFAEGTITGIANEWQKFSLPLTSLYDTEDGTETRCYIEIDKGIIYADMLSLMPTDTYKGTYIRKDIGAYLEALTPTFLRFPGGCVIEGRDLESMYSWKDSIGNGLEFTINGETTVGDVAVRPQGKSIWNGTKGHPYYTSYGIGFYEFFELCDLFNCMPIPILNAGMTCQVQSPKYIVYDLDSEEFAQCIQDALDLVEFCKGDESTRWGKVRIDMGHEEPFALTYIGIGNEQWQAEYFQHYKKFTQAFSAAAKENPELYGEIELIIANGPSSGDRVGWNYLDGNEDEITTLVDEHYYETPNWFLTNTLRYDKYDRDTQAKVFLGEYAAQSNTLEAALAEAAYMTGLERNSDIVHMACYAPLFGNKISNQWTPDLIWYSQKDVHGSVNYYVQKLFGNNVGDTILPSSLDTSHLTQESALSGKVGLGSWQTEVAYDNIMVTANDTGEVLYECTFDNEALLKEDGWEVNEGEWSIVDGRLVQEYSGAPSNTNTGESIYIGDTSWGNYTVTVEAEILSGDEGFIIPICVKDEANHMFWNLGGWGNSVSCLQIVSGNSKSGQISGTVKNCKLNHKQVYTLKVVVEGSSIQCFVNDMKYMDYTYEAAESLYETASITESGDMILKIVNVSDQEIQMDTVLEDIDLTKFQTTATTTVLKGEKLSDVNSFEEPEKMIPIEGTIEISSQFVYNAPPYSVSVIRILGK